MSTVPAQSPAASAWSLTPPEVIQPVPDAMVKTAVPLPAATQQAVSQQVDVFVNALLQEDVHSDSFKAKLDSAFALGREEISVAATLMQGRFMDRNGLALHDTPAFAAIEAMRSQLDELNPGKAGDLMQPSKLLGFIPFGNQLKTYFRRFQSTGSQLNTTLQQLYAAKDDLQRDVVDIESTRTKLWDGMQKLASAIQFAQALDERLASQVLSLKATDPTRAQALEQEVLFYARQNLQDMLTQQAVCTNGYLALDVLKKTARELMNGCSRVATTGMSALAVAQTVAQATGHQIQVMNTLQNVNATLGDLVAETGRQLGQHVEKTAEFQQNPLLGVERIQEMFNQTFAAMDAMDSFRSRAVEVMSQNNALIAKELKRSESYVDRVRQQAARQAVGHSAQLAGPVKL